MKILAAILLSLSLVIMIVFLIASIGVFVNFLKQGRKHRASDMIKFIIGSIVVLITLILLMNLAF